MKQVLNNPYYVNVLQPRIKASYRPGAGVSTVKTKTQERIMQEQLAKEAAAARLRPSRSSSGQPLSQATTPSSVQRTEHDSFRTRQSSRQSSDRPLSPLAQQAKDAIKQGTVNTALKSYARSLTHI